MPNSNKGQSRKRPQTKKINQKTNKSKQVTTVTPKQNKKSKKKQRKHPKLRMFIKITLILFLLLCIIGAGIVAAIFYGLFGDDLSITKDDLTIGASNTIIVDKDGNEIANLSTDEKRRTVTLSEMSPYLPKAYIAIEDKRFYSHSGVDIKRTTGAILGKLTGHSSYGGSSITQQLIKNITKEDAREGMAGITRKIKEWSKAIQVERMISKDQILELYLNCMFIGGNQLHGVQLGAIHYFNKNAKDLDLAECAFLAGINNAPNKYNPFGESGAANAKIIKDRTKTVLDEMKKQGLIENEDEYNAAVAKVETGLPFIEGDTSSNSTYSYHTDAAINQVIEQVMEEKGVSRDFARNYVYGSGLTIYSTENLEIQQTVEKEFENTKYQVKGREKKADGTFKNEHSQAAIVIMDHSTGQVLAVGGELGNKYATGWNRGTQMVRQTGSSMKPIAAVLPALQEKVITAATVYDDATTDFGGGYKPGDYNTPQGLINIRSCIRTSQNIPMVKIVAELGVAKSVQYLEKMGITTLENESLPISIGGVTNGISPLEMASAYSTIANDGVHITPTFYTKVVDSNGNTVLTPKQEKTRVISEQNAYIVRSIIKEPLLSGGTATYCKIPGMETCAKTGSTDKYKDRWLCGMTPYYTAACWFGYDEAEGMSGILFSGQNPAGYIWAQIMKAIHTNLPNKNFSQASGIVSASVCRASGCIATTGCTDVYTEIFTADNMPEACQGHGAQEICEASGKLANEFCPREQVKVVGYGAVILKEQLKLWNTITPSSSSVIATKVEGICDIHTKPVEKPVEKPIEKPTNTTNTTGNNNTSENTNSTTGNNTTGGSNGNTSGGNTTPDQNVTN
ncbi:MAG: hypothetical protein HFJ59_03775 [Clostridia bacterium]|nr:hypothetical protein [Clostridia bacterium]